MHLQMQAHTVVRRKRRGRIYRASRNAFDFIKSYFNESCIHGFLYLAKNQLTWYERCIWLILLIVSVYMCIVISLQSVNRYYTKSTVISLERDLYFWRTTLPSLTICPTNRINQVLFDDYCGRNNIDGKQKDEFQDFLETLANSTFINIENINNTKYASIPAILNKLDVDPNTYMQLIYNLTMDFAAIYDENARIVADEGTYYVHVQQVLTEFGLCYMTNNYLSDVYTARNFIFGEKSIKARSLELVVRGTYFDKEIRYTMRITKGPPLYWTAMGAVMHSAYDVMKYDNSYLYTAEGIYYYAASSEMSTDDELEKTTSVEQRSCRFPNESNLTHFPIYTKNLCMQECRINLIYKTCNCIPHFYPNRLREPKPVCSYKHLRKCLMGKADFFRNVFGSKQTRISPCYCLENCAESNVVLKNKEILYNTQLIFDGLTCTVEVKTWPRIRLKRQVIFTFTDLLVSIGSTAGLFLGFSVLSAIEFLYYFTLRLFYYLRGYKI